jgi:hypothetical protein
MPSFILYPKEVLFRNACESSADSAFAWRV